MKNKLLYTSLYALMIGGTLALSVSNLVMAKGVSGTNDIYVDDELEGNENFKNKVMWSNAVDDPGLGGTQLAGTKYEDHNVRDVYGDTLGYGADLAILGGKMRNFSNSVADYTRAVQDEVDLEEDRQECRNKIIDLKEKYNDLQRQSDAKWDYVDSLIKEHPEATQEEYDKARARLLSFCPSCENWLDTTTALMTNPETRASEDAKTALNDFLKSQFWRNHIKEEEDAASKITEDWQKTGDDLDKAKDDLRKVLAAIDETKSSNETYLPETMKSMETALANVTPAEREAIFKTLKDLNNTWVEGNSTELQQNLNRFADLYGIEKGYFDLSTDFGKTYADTFISGALVYTIINDSKNNNSENNTSK